MIEIILTEYSTPLLDFSYKGQVIKDGKQVYSTPEFDSAANVLDLCILKAQTANFKLNIERIFCNA